VKYFLKKKNGKKWYNANQIWSRENGLTGVNLFMKVQLNDFPIGIIIVIKSFRVTFHSLFEQCYYNIPVFILLFFLSNLPILFPSLSFLFLFLFLSLFVWRRWLITIPCRIEDCSSVVVWRIAHMYYLGKISSHRLRLQPIIDDLILILEVSAEEQIFNCCGWCYSNHSMPVIWIYLLESR